MKESTAGYGKSIKQIRDKEKNAAIKPKDRETLGKLADLMKKQKRTEAYRKPTQAEIDADKRKERKASGEKRPSVTSKSLTKKVYGNLMNKKESSSQEFTAVPVNPAGDISGGDRMSIAKLSAMMQKRSKDMRQKESSLPPHLQGIIGKDGNIDPKKVKKDPVLNKNKTKVTDVTPKGYGPKESVATADRKPQNYRDPVTGKLKTRMVPVDKDVVRGDAAAKVVKKKKFDAYY